MQKRRHHAALWLCIDNNSSADKATPRFLHSLSSLKCHEPGMARRVRHLRMLQSPASKDLAAAAIAGQRSEENTSIDQHREKLSPLSRPCFLLRDYGAMRCLDMTTTQARTIYRKYLAGRLKKARRNKRLSQAQTAEALRIEKEAYKKMEQRGAMPADLIEPFALLVDEDALFILTGRREESSPVLPKKKRA